MGKQSKHIFYTPEQEQWLIDNYYLVNSYDELTELFNKRFCINRNKDSIRDKCSKRLGLKGKINSTLAVFSLKQLGWRDQQQVDVGTDTKKSIKITLVKPD